MQDLTKLWHNTKKKVQMQLWIQLIIAFAILFSFLQLLVIKAETIIATASKRKA